MVRNKMIFVRLLIFLLLLSFPAFASEDGDSYDENIDFSFDDLPPIEENASSQNVSQITGAKTEAVTVTDLSPTVKEESSDSAQDIFIPERPKIAIPQPAVVASAPDKQEENDSISISSKDTLTENLKKNSPPKNDSIFDGTWIEKLAEMSPNLLPSKKEEPDEDEYEEDDDEEDKDYDLDNLMNRYRRKSKSGKSNASVFDIAGIMLRMNVNQVDDIMRNRGFKRINARYQIPNFIKWRNEESCRSTGIVGYERTQSCVIQKAKKDGYEYIQYLKYAKFESKEEIEIYFTSKFTDNKAYKIIYRSTIASITGNSPKAVYIRNLKVYDFWRRINRKYGPPDDKTMVLWGLGGNKPYLNASTGYLKLEDPMFAEMDYTRMSREDQKFIHSDFYNF